jgi:hypothetical protein
MKLTEPPQIEVRKTISDIHHPEKVVGFKGRNTRLGQKSIVMKKCSAKGDRVVIPKEIGDELYYGDGELLYLDGDNVLALSAQAFKEYADLIEVHNSDGEEEVYRMNLFNKTWMMFDRDEVEITL